MATLESTSPNVQVPTSPLSSAMDNANASPVHSPVATYVVGGATAPVVTSPSVSVRGGLASVQSPTAAQGASPQTREVSTVYLPPIRYRYDNATGTLVQVSGPSPTSQVQSTVTSVPANFANLSSTLGSSSPSVQANLSQTVPPLNQNLTALLNGSNQLNPNSVNRVQTPRSQAFQYANLNPQTVFLQAGQPQAFGQTLQGQSFAGPQVPNRAFVTQPVYANNAPSYVAGPQFAGYGNVPGPAFQGAGFPNVPNFGQQGLGTQRTVPSNLRMGPQPNDDYRNYYNQLYMDTPRARYESAVKEYYDRMHGNFENYNPDPQTPPNGFTQAFSAFGDAAQRFFSNPDSFVSDFKTAAFRMFNPNYMGHLKAAVFRLHRVENVPVNPNHVSKLSFSVVAYFDPTTENYNTFKTQKQWALPTETSGLVNCDFRGETLKVPWKGEEFVFLKVVEHVGENRFVLGRLQLKLDSLVTGRLLKVNVVGDDGLNKGNALFEFDVGGVTAEEFNRMNVESFKNANFGSPSLSRRHEYTNRDNFDNDFARVERNHYQSARRDTSRTRTRCKLGKSGGKTVSL